MTNLQRSGTTMPTKNTPPSDPLFRSSLRELKWIIVIWLASFIWVIGYCWLFGYSPDQPIALVFGIPSWAFWGIFAPWGLATAVSCWFALTQMQDHPLDLDGTDEQTEATDA